ncbi:hypothetical protein [Aquabacterium sp.]|uniref:hypothetical protein n=1 Tax=Aquabacterium sp. TaxID=1872578 RepID=UPI0037841EFA
MDSLAPANAPPGPAGRPELGWLRPGEHGSPAEVVARIGSICQGIPNLFCAMLAVLGTHQGLPKGIVAAAIKQFRRDLDDLTREDTESLLIAIWNGGQQGFDAVLRSRRRSERKAASLPWAASD